MSSRTWTIYLYRGFSSKLPQFTRIDMHMMEAQRPKLCDDNKKYDENTPHVNNNINFFVYSDISLLFRYF